MAHLTDLVHFGLAAIMLEVDPGLDTLLSENVVAATYSLLKTKPVKQLAQIVEANVRI